MRPFFRTLTIGLGLLVGLTPIRAEEKESVSPETKRAIEKMGGKVTERPLKALSISVTLDPITDEDLATLTNDLKRIKNLQLYLGGPKLTDAGIGSLKDYTSLHTLRLSSPAVTDVGLKESLMGLKNLQSLMLPCAKLTDKGLAGIKGMADLRLLALRGTAVTDAGLKELAGLKKLEALYLGETNFTDAAVKELKELKSLQSLQLDKTGITDAGVEELKEALPTCRITRQERD